MTDFSYWQELDALLPKNSKSTVEILAGVSGVSATIKMWRHISAFELLGQHKL
jgi:hypothetical protein